MYNVKTVAAIIAVAQQAIKKAPVTSPFAQAKPQAGLAMQINYGRFSTIGQAFLIIPSPAIHETETGDGLSFHLLSFINLRSSIRQWIGEWITSLSRSPRGFPSATGEDYPWIWLLVVVKNKESQVLMVPDFQKLLSNLHTSLRFRCYQHLQRHGPNGEGDFVPHCSFQEEG